MCWVIMPLMIYNRMHRREKRNFRPVINRKINFPIKTKKVSTVFHLMEHLSFTSWGSIVGDWTFKREPAFYPVMGDRFFCSTVFQKVCKITFFLYSMAFYRTSFSFKAIAMLMQVWRGVFDAGWALLMVPLDPPLWRKLWKFPINSIITMF